MVQQSTQSESTGNEEREALDFYLDTICARMDAAVEQEVRIEARAEMRSHLEALIDANIELGDSPQLALKHALEQFGNARKVGSQYNNVATAHSPGSFRRSLRLAFGVNAAACAVSLTVIPIGMRYAADLGWQAVGSITDLGIYGLPACAGLLIGLFAKRRPVAATVVSMLALMVPMMILDAINSMSIGSTAWLIGAVSQLAIFLLCWIPFGCAGAMVGSLARRLIHSVSASRGVRA